MTHDQLIADLTRRRRELTHEISGLCARAKQLTDDVQHIDRVMMMFRPEADPTDIPALAYRKQPDWKKSGEQARAIFDVLRHAEGPMTTIDVTDRIMLDRGVIDEDRAAHRKRIYKALVQQRRRGLIMGVPVGGRLRWQLCRKGEVSDPEGGWRNGNSEAS